MLWLVKCRRPDPGAKRLSAEHQPRVGFVTREPKAQRVLPRKAGLKLFPARWLWKVSIDIAERSRVEVLRWLFLGASSEADGRR